MRNVLGRWPVISGPWFILIFAVACSRQPPSPKLAAIAEGEVESVDLGYALNEKNPYWPGPAYKPFHFETIATVEKDGVFSGSFSTPEHLGTHVDAPNHFEVGQPSIDQIALKNLIAPIVVIDIRKACENNADYRLTKKDIEAWEQEHYYIPNGAFVFALTGWGKYWSDYNRYQNRDALGRLHFPGFSEEAARFLMDSKKAKGIGIDTLSVDHGLSTDFKVHHIVNGAGAYNIENAANLEKVPVFGGWVIAAPIKLDRGSGGPARVWAVWNR